MCSNGFLGQMSSFEFPFNDAYNDQINFYTKHKIQIPFFNWNNKTLLRISIQVYNNKEDIYKLINSLKYFLNNR